MGTRLEGKFSGWLEWEMPVMLCVLAGVFQRLPGMVGAVGWLGCRDTGLAGMEEQPRN